MMTVKWTRELETVKKLRSECEKQDKLMTSWDWRREESLREKETAKDQLRDYEVLYLVEPQSIEIISRKYENTCTYVHMNKDWPNLS